MRKALAVARIYKAMAQVPRGEPTAYWDEHSLDEQRYYDTLCMIYGRDPKGNAKLVSSKALPDERAGLCKEDYLRIESSWKTLLKPYANDSLWTKSPAERCPNCRHQTKYCHHVFDTFWVSRESIGVNFSYSFIFSSGVTLAD